MAASLGAAEPVPQWIWGSEEREPNQAICLKTQFTIERPLRRAECVLTAEYCNATIYLNGHAIATQEPFGPLVKLNLGDAVRQGKNTLGLGCLSIAGPAAVMARLELESADGERQILVTGKDWHAAITESGKPPVWPADQKAWKPATILGAVDSYAWGLEPDTIAISPLDDYTQWMRASKEVAGADPKTFQVAPGFTVELIRSAQKEEDSWISLASDPQGRWIIGMEKQGLLRLTIPPAGAAVKVERINTELHECRGLVFAHDSLYAMANNDRALFRLRDLDGDDQFEKVEKLISFDGDVGHGRNQLTLGPDGQVWGIFGDSVFEPASAVKFPPALAKPTAVESTRSGFVARFNADASEMKIVTRGLRNPFGIGFNPHGEMFTYDADAEYDMGGSWYRPTRIVHLLPGGDFGWRRVTQQWPPYFPDRADMPQPTLDIGKGSPTAVAFGTNSSFPERYRSALFALDWAYGRILAIHLTPRGSSYQAAAETFLRGQPLNVTDVEFGADGAMYFVTGGRGTQSALYRVKYSGEQEEPSQPTEQQRASERWSEQARATRRRLESFLEAPVADNLTEIWPHLGSPDPWIRHAARAALEKLPVSTWRNRAQDEQDFNRSLAARIALSRQGEPAGWIGGKWQSADRRQKPELLYLAERALAQTTKPEERNAVLNELRAAYPTEDPFLNQSLSNLLSNYPEDTFVRKTLALLDKATTQTERLHYCFVLRQMPVGWTAATRQAYFAHLREMEDFIGGEGLPTFRKLIRDEALAAVPANERAQYERLLTPVTPAWALNLPPARTQVVRKWTVEELAAAWNEAQGKRDLARGKQVFAAARCIMCHRAGAPGGVSGPDLTSVARRFAPRDILTSILEPSKAIDEKYTAVLLQLADGRVLTGRIAPGDYRSPELELITNLLEPEKRTKVAKADVVRRQTSPVSPMPTGLVDGFQQAEILDLLAYLLSLERPQ